MKPVRIFRHIANEGPGYLARFLDRQHIPFDVVAIDAGQSVPARLDDVSGLVFMGGPMSVNDPLPWIADEIALIQQAARRQLPVLGHCLGGQLISKALGGRIVPNPVKEIGWHGVTRIDTPAAQTWLDGLPAEFEVFHWHGETFTLPDGATPILSSRFCAQQGFVLDNILALQCHIEMTEAMVRDWAAVNDAEIAQPSDSVQSAAQMAERLTARVQTLQQRADVFYSRWVQPILASSARN